MQEPIFHTVREAAEIPRRCGNDLPIHPGRMIPRCPNSHPARGSCGLITCDGGVRLDDGSCVPHGLDSSRRCQSLPLRQPSRSRAARSCS